MLSQNQSKYTENPKPTKKEREKERERKERKNERKKEGRQEKKRKASLISGDLEGRSYDSDVDMGEHSLEFQASPWAAPTLRVGARQPEARLRALGKPGPFPPPELSYKKTELILYKWEEFPLKKQIFRVCVRIPPTLQKACLP